MPTLRHPGRGDVRVVSPASTFSPISPASPFSRWCEPTVLPLTGSVMTARRMWLLQLPAAGRVPSRIGPVATGDRDTRRKQAGGIVPSAASGGRRVRARAASRGSGQALGHPPSPVAPRCPASDLSRARRRNIGVTTRRTPRQRALGLVGLDPRAQACCAGEAPLGAPSRKRPSTGSMRDRAEGEIRTASETLRCISYRDTVPKRRPIQVPDERQGLESAWVSGSPKAPAARPLTPWLPRPMCGMHTKPPRSSNDSHILPLPDEPAAEDRLTGVGSPGLSPFEAALLAAIERVPARATRARKAA